MNTYLANNFYSFQMKNLTNTRILGRDFQLDIYNQGSNIVDQTGGTGIYYNIDNNTLINNKIIVMAQEISSI